MKKLGLALLLGLLVQAVHAEFADCRTLSQYKGGAVAAYKTGFITRLTQNSMSFHGSVATLDYGGQVQGDEEGERLAAAVAQGANAIFLQNHGVILVGATPAEAAHEAFVALFVPGTLALLTSSRRRAPNRSSSLRSACTAPARSTVLVAEVRCMKAGGRSSGLFMAWLAFRRKRRIHAPCFVRRSATGRPHAQNGCSPH